MESRTRAVYENLVRRARSGVYRPGDRFLSNRAVVSRFGVSYQTAHRLLAKMVADGVLQRSSRSGTYLAGHVDRPTSVCLIFHSRAAQAGSFGAKLLASIRRGLEAMHVGCSVVLADDDGDAGDLPGHRLPILWEAPRALDRCLREHRRAILVNDRPAASLDASAIDSVAVDDFAGGVMAAQFLIRTHGRRGRLGAIGGPRRDRRSQARVAGFTSEAGKVALVHAEDWFTPAGEAAAAKLLARKIDGVFCCNDRLAEGFLRACRKHHGRDLPPPVVGFDDAPVAERFGLTTVAIPWDALANAVTRLARQRLNGSDDPATHLVLFPTVIPRVLRIP